MYIIQSIPSKSEFQIQPIERYLTKQFFRKWVVLFQGKEVSNLRTTLCVPDEGAVKASPLDPRIIVRLLMRSTILSNLSCNGGTQGIVYRGSYNRIVQPRLFCRAKMIHQRDALNSMNLISESRGRVSVNLVALLICVRMRKYKCIRTFVDSLFDKKGVWINYICGIAFVLARNLLFYFF